MKNDIVVTRVDYSRLNSLILNMLDDRSSDLFELNFLNIEIKRATKIDSRKISPEYVTMNSLIEVTFLDVGKSMVIRLVYPQDANYKKGQVSVLSPLGCALLGYRAGDSVSFKAPGGMQTVRIDKVLYQPEANGIDLQ
jgi:regulator of nucleoside diphosphate kinase